MENYSLLKQGFALNSKSKHYLSDEENGIPLLKISDLFNNTETLFVKKEIPKQFLVFEDEIIYSRTGQVGYAFMGKKGVIYNNCFKVIPNEEKINKKFLYKILNTEIIRNYAQTLATGTAQPDLNHDAFKSIKINLPPLETQQKIVNLISNYDDLIENNNKRIKLLESMAEELYKEWFVRLRFPNYQNTKIVDGIPHGWEYINLGKSKLKFIDGDRGKNYPKQDEFFENGYCLFLNTSNVTKNGFVFDSKMFITREKDNILGNGKLKYGDIIITTRGTLGNIAIYNSKNKFTNVRINSSMLIIRDEKLSFSEYYLHQYFISNYFQKNIKLFSSGSAQPQLPVSTINSIKILVPPKNTLEEFSKLIKSLYDEIDILQQKNQTLKQTRNLLLPRLLSGKLDIEKLDIN